MSYHRSIAILFCVLFLVTGCSRPKPTTNDLQREQQARITKEGALEVGAPAIEHFREMRMMKLIYEMRDQDDLSSWTYIEVPLTGKFILVCESIGFPIPYSTQFSAPTAMQTYNIPGISSGSSLITYGLADLPQAEPNGLHMPASAEGTWVLCVGPDRKPYPSYIEPKIMTSLYPLPDSLLQK